MTNTITLPSPPLGLSAHAHSLSSAMNIGFGCCSDRGTPAIAAIVPLSTSEQALSGIDRGRGVGRGVGLGDGGGVRRSAGTWYMTVAWPLARDSRIRSRWLARLFSIGPK